MTYSEDEAKERLFNAIRIVKDHPSIGEEWLQQNLPSFVKGYRPDTYLYKPDQALIDRINDYQKWCKEQKGEDPGQLLEEIALLAFKCLRGWNSIKSYQSYAPQHDLVISGLDTDWISFIYYLNPAWQRRTIVVEAKNYNEKIDDAIFSRLCSILSTIFEDTSNLGVFFTRLGASGFPDGEITHRQRTLSNAQATQIIFHAKTGKCVVVFTHDDILRLTEVGALPRILEAKIRAIEEFTGLPVHFDESLKEIDLPKHLKKHL